MLSWRWGRKNRLPPTPEEGGLRCIRCFCHSSWISRPSRACPQTEGLFWGPRPCLPGGQEPGNPRVLPARLSGGRGGKRAELGRREEEPLSEQVLRCPSWQVLWTGMPPWRQGGGLVGGSPAVPTRQVAPPRAQLSSLAASGRGGSVFSRHAGLRVPGHRLWAARSSRGVTLVLPHTHLQSPIIPCCF